jgi:hypothetical protein
MKASQCNSGKVFAKKANWYRMVARVADKKQEAEAVEGPAKKRPWKAFG